MRIDITKEEDVVIISLQGSVEILNYSGLESEIKKFFQGEDKKLLLDCTNLVYISSTGLRAFMTAYKQAMEYGVLMTVSGLQDTVKYVFDVTGFSELLNICATKEEAMQFLKD